MTNQLADEAAALPDLTEFDGMSIREIAYAIYSWDEGSEDQGRAIAAISGRAPGFGHNRPPLEERLDEEFATLRARADKVLAVAATVTILSDESAAKALDVMAEMRGVEADVDTLRKKLQTPYHSAIAAIGARAANIMDPVKVARVGQPGERGRGGLQATITAYDDQRRREQEEARLKAAEEARKREEAAQEARRKADEAARAQQGSARVPEATAQKLEEEADRAAARAEAFRAPPPPIRSNLAQATRRKEIRFEVTNIRDLLGELLRDAADRASIQEMTETIVRRKLTRAGVAAVERGIEIKGLRAWVELGAITTRR